MVDAPETEARSIAVMGAIKKVIPAKPIRYVVNTHSHFDHAGGLRTYAAEGATMQMMLGNGFGFNWQGLYVNSLLDAHSNWRMERQDFVKTFSILRNHYSVVLVDCPKALRSSVMEADDRE